MNNLHSFFSSHYYWSFHLDRLQGLLKEGEEVQRVLEAHGDPHEPRGHPGLEPRLLLEAAVGGGPGVHQEGPGVPEVRRLEEADGLKEAARPLQVPQVQGEDGPARGQVLPGVPVGGVLGEARVAEGLHLGVALEALGEEARGLAHPRNPQGHGLQALEEEVGVEGGKGHAAEGKPQGADEFTGRRFTTS